jgi:hypothetical protein
VATLRVSVDGGMTWGNEQQAGLGRVGEYLTKVYWDQLGAPEDCVLEFVWSDNAPTYVINAFCQQQASVPHERSHRPAVSR